MDVDLKSSLEVLEFYPEVGPVDMQTFYYQFVHHFDSR